MRRQPARKQIAHTKRVQAKATKRAAARQPVRASPRNMRLPDAKPRRMQARSHELSLWKLEQAGKVTPPRAIRMIAYAEKVKAQEAAQLAEVASLRERVTLLMTDAIEEGDKAA